MNLVKVVYLKQLSNLTKKVTMVYLEINQLLVDNLATCKKAVHRGILKINLNQNLFQNLDYKILDHQTNLLAKKSYHKMSKLIVEINNNMEPLK